MARTLVTGIGVIAPNGVGTEDYWSATLAGKSGIDRLTHMDQDRYAATVAGTVDGFVVSEHVPSRLVVQTDRLTQFGLAAAGMALADARLDPATLPEFQFSVVTASASGGNEFGQREIQKLWSKGPQHVGAYQSIAWFYAATTGQVSIRFGARGPCGVIVSEQASGLDALAQARRVLRGGARVVISGGTEALAVPVRAGVPERQRRAQQEHRSGARVPAVRLLGERSRAGRGRGDADSRVRGFRA